MMLRSALTCAMLTALLNLSADAAPVQRQADPAPANPARGSLTDARKFLEGTWVLESFEVHQPGKPVVTLKGAGTLTYDDFGNLAMEIRADQASSDLLRASGIDIADGVISTRGRTVVDMQGRTLTYVLEGQPGPGRGRGPLAASRPRYWQVEGNILTLTTKDDAGNPASVGKWRKVR